jgi:SH3 domain-containing YSC84-like protein 1
VKRILVLAFISGAVLLGNLGWAASERDDAVERLKNSAEVLKAIASTPDESIPEEVVAHSKCIAVIPTLVKAGLVVGAKYGHGVAGSRSNSRTNSGPRFGWSAPAFITVGGGNIGAQIGAEGVGLGLGLGRNERQGNATPALDEG